MPPFDWFPNDMPYEQVVSIHLSGNFYPPLPQDYVPLAVEARGACLDGDWDRPIVIPAGTNPVPREAEAMFDGTWQIAAAKLLGTLRLDVYNDEEE